MRAGFAAAVALYALLTGPAIGEQTFPYTAYVATDNAYVRSGPGENHYPTGKLRRGDRVEIYRHDPGGWCAIRPVEGSFTWVPGRYVDPGEDGLGTIVEDGVAARVGSQFSDIRDAIWVRLHQGEIVEVLGKKQFRTEPEPGLWYKIAPPAGEFRWVFGKDLNPKRHHGGIREQPAGGSGPLLAPGRSSDDGALAAPRDPSGARSNDGLVDPVQSAGHWSLSKGRSERASEPGSPEIAAPSLREVEADRFKAPLRSAGDSFRPEAPPTGNTPMRRLSPEQLQAELDDVDLELSIMLAEEPTVWKLDELAIRAKALLAEAETAVERGRVRLVANRIAQADQIKRRYEAVSGMYDATERHNRQLADLGRIRDPSRLQPPSEGRFDGVGRLVRAVPSRLGGPRYALVDDRGDVRCYVTPAPGVRLDYHAGRRIGVSGIRGYLAEQGARHVTAKHVTVLDDRRLR